MKRKLWIAACTVAVLVLSACGGGGSSSSAPSTGAGALSSSSGSSSPGGSSSGGSSGSGSYSIWVSNSDSTVTELMPAAVAASACAPTSCITFSGGGMDGTGAIAVDQRGNVWVVNSGDSSTNIAASVTEITAAAVAAGSCSTATCINFNGYGLETPVDIGVDPSGNVWVANELCFSTSTQACGADENGTLTEIKPGATAGCASGCFEFEFPQAPTGLPEIAPLSLTADAQGDIWFTSDGCISTPSCQTPQSVIEIPPTDIQTGSCTAAPLCPIYTGVGVGGIIGGIGMDISGNVWVAGSTTTEIQKGAPTSCVSGCTTFGTSAVADTDAVIGDAQGNLWVTSDIGQTLTEITAAAIAAGSCTAGTCPDYQIGGFEDGPRVLAVAPDGHIWVAAPLGTGITEVTPGAAQDCSTGCITIPLPNEVFSIAIMQ